MSVSLRQKLLEKSNCLIKLLNVLISLNTSDYEMFEALCAACSVYNSEIYFLVVDHKMKPRKIDKNFVKDTKSIFRAVGERSAWDVFFNNHSGVIIGGTTPFLVIDIIIYGAMFYFDRKWLNGLGMAFMLVLAGLWIKVIYPYWRDAGIGRMASRIHSRNTYFNRKKQQKMLKFSSVLDVVRKIKDIGPF